MRKGEKENADFMSPVGSDSQSTRNRKNRFWKRKRIDCDTSTEEASDIEALPPNGRPSRAKRGHEWEECWARKDDGGA